MKNDKAVVTYVENDKFTELASLLVYTHGNKRLKTPPFDDLIIINDNFSSYKINFLNKLKNVSLINLPDDVDKNNKLDLIKYGLNFAFTSYEHALWIDDGSIIKPLISCFSHIDAEGFLFLRNLISNRCILGLSKNKGFNLINSFGKEVSTFEDFCSKNSLSEMNEKNLIIQALAHPDIEKLKYKPFFFRDKNNQVIEYAE